MAAGMCGAHKFGLGYANKRKLARGKHQRCLKAVTRGDDTFYATIKGDTASVVELSPRGRPVTTGEVELIQESDVIRELVWWRGGIIGIAELTYPHPQGWTVVGAEDGATLDTLSVAMLTAIYRCRHEKVPTCFASWTKRLPGLAIPWSEISRMFRGGLLTPKDYSSYFKNILHRALLTRSKCPTEDGATCCRCCMGPTEHLAHLADCPALLPLWERIATLGNLECTPRLALLGVQGNEAMPMGLAALWLIVWKFTIISFTQAGIEGTPVCIESIWNQAVRRLVGRAHSALHVFRRSRMAAVGKGAPPPATEALNKLLRPLGTVSQAGVLEWSPSFKVHLEEAGVTAPTAYCTESATHPEAEGDGPKPIAFVAATHVQPRASTGVRRPALPPGAARPVHITAQCCPVSPSSHLACHTPDDMTVDPLDQEREMLQEWDAAQQPPLP